MYHKLTTHLGITVHKISVIRRIMPKCRVKGFYLLINVVSNHSESNVYDLVGYIIDG